jgi:hypothetical protein
VAAMWTDHRVMYLLITIAVVGLAMVLVLK